jgi:hypothetical protein
LKKSAFFITTSCSSLNFVIFKIKLYIFIFANTNNPNSYLFINTLIDKMMNQEEWQTNSTPPPNYFEHLEQKD